VTSSAARSILEAYTLDNDVLPVVIYAIPSISTCLVVNALMKGFLGILRPLKMQYLSIYVLSICIYGIALPAAWFFGVTLEYGIAGLWYGLATGYSVANIVFIYFMCTTDWQAVIDEEQNL
jgi:multidrug resistance protein, MATE family